MKATLATHLAVLASLVLQCRSSPIPVLGGLLKLGGSSSSSKQKIPTLQESHADAMRDGYTEVQQAHLNKLNEFAQARSLRQQGHPVYHSSEEDYRGIYSNKKYRDSVHKTQAHKSSFEAAHTKVKQHLNVLANQKEPKKVRNLEEMKLEAGDMNRSMKEAHPLINEHIEDEGAPEEIGRLFTARTQSRDLAEIRVPKDISDIDAKGKEFDDILNRTPNSYQIG